ncbi:type II toxin-antitoxin system PemK/MazF family toxin [Arthrobacter sp. GN70]|nr:type II toxin-antitoxin system PemK/MazF family toxin [Arthrobacter sp. GN70]
MHRRRDSGTRRPATARPMPDLERGQMVWVNFNPSKGSEQAGHRPALVIADPATMKSIDLWLRDFLGLP